MSEVLSEADVFVFPSSRESFGIPLVEALALGVPTICTDLPQFREIGGDAPVYVKEDARLFVDRTGELSKHIARVERYFKRNCKDFLQLWAQTRRNLATQSQGQ